MDKVILAKNIVLDGEPGQTRPNDNQIVFGGTGSGKSMSVVYPTLAHMRNSSLIGTFAKKSVVANAEAYFRQMGYRTYIWNLANPKEGERVPDPLVYVCSDDDVQELAKAIANGNPKYEKSTNYDPYWRESSESLITGLIYYILMTEDHPCMKQVIDLFYSLTIKENGKAITTSLDNIVDWLQDKAPESIAARKLKSFTQLPYSTAGCVRDTLEKAIQNIFPVSIQKNMSEAASVKFEDFASERTAIFILTSPVRVSQYGFANLIFSMAIKHLMEFAETQPNNRLPLDVKLVFDDFSCGFPVQNYEKSISTFRAAGISSLMLCQSLSQLNETYGENKATVIMDNCSSLLYFPGGMNQKTAQYVGTMLDLPMSDILFMPMGNVVVCQSGSRPVIVPRYETLKDPLYQEMMAAGEKTGELRSA